ncbi:MAG: 3'-5' exonuclease [Planctomycetes bacterium]|nr:3'-5' exonuclease [Planctomycetota bacterium]
MLAFDIETYAAWDSLSPALRDYLEGRDQARGIAPDHRRAAAQTASLLPGVAQVIAVGLWGGEANSERLSLSLDPTLETPHVDKKGDLDEGWVRHCFRAEADLLRAFWALVGEATAAGRRLVSFNGRAFDGPMLSLRSAVLGIPPSVALVGPRQNMIPHTDLVELLSFSGARRDRYTFAYWCEVFGVASPKQELNGAAVGGAFERGEHETIARYALEDARATGELYQRLQPTLVPLVGSE